MKVIYPLIFFLLAQQAGQAQTKYEQLSVTHIPVELRENAVAVVRFDSTEFTILDQSRLRYKQRMAVTILKPEGTKYGNIEEEYNNLVKLTGIKATLLDAAGKVLSKAKEKDFFDVAAFAFDLNFHSDSRVKRFSFNRGSFPFTVVLEVSYEFKTTFFLPTWHPQPHPEVAVQEAVLTASYPRAFQVRFQTHKLPASYSYNSIDSEERITEIFKVTDVKSFKPQPYAREGNFILPAIQCAPSQFELMHHQGDMTTWSSLGKFIYNLNEGRDELPEDKKVVVKELLEGISDPYNKIDILYRYLQQNTRYFANVYGLSGWQTFDAKSVAQSGYGDCKGLTNYLRALLKEAGIAAYSTLVYAGAEDYIKIDPEFPGNFFNHVILCVPMEKDTVWLECTNPTLPTGYLGSFTQDRWVLVTTPEGGQLRRTPSYDLKENFVNRKVNLQLSDEKQLQVTMHNTYSGLLQEDLFKLIKTEDERKIKEQANKKFAFPSYKVSQYTYEDQMNSGVPQIWENVQAQVSGMLSQSGNRSFIQLNWLPNPMTNIYQDIARTEPIVLERSFTITDTIVLTVPEEKKAEHLPAPFNIDQPFGKFVFEATQKDQQITVVRHFEQYKGVYEPSVFQAYQEMYRRINSGNNDANIVLVQE